MRVKELSLQGFKSFAGKHRFAFPAGITAVVGPNGSGKSNIADGVRWVLGEQRSTTLRAKRTEEIIFAGTERRARSGMAEVSLTLDNDERWLDVDFAEVVISRRAHRDGVNTYLVNGAPVRLRDVLDLVGSHLGHGGYTVIGQGMVDNALSMRPDERRVLIDEAAGIVPLQRRRDRALQRLSETNDNLTRVRDILEELGPRMRRMARLADRAARHAAVSTDLRVHLLHWYGHHWFRAGLELDRARQLVIELRREADAARELGAAAVAEARTLATAREAATARLSRERDARERCTGELVAARQAAAVAVARLDGLAARVAEHEEGTRSASAMLQTQEDHVAQLAGEVERLAVVEEARRTELEQARGALSLVEERHDAHGRLIEGARAEVLGLEAAATAARDRLEAAVVEGDALDAERAAAEGALGRAREAVNELVAAATAADADASAAAERHTLAVEDVNAAEAALAETDHGLAAVRETHARATAELGAVRARAEALEALFGERNAADEALAALRDVRGVEVVGRVAELLEVAEGWEGAVAAALASHVHGLVVRGESASLVLATAVPAERGSITLVPLGQGPPHGRWSPAPGESTSASVARAPRAPGLVDALLGGTAFVEDAEAAARTMARDGRPTQAATRDGRLLLPHGVVVLGAPGREVLVLEAERRSLPSRIVAAAARAAELAADMDRMAAERRHHEGRLTELSRARRERDREHADARDRADRARSEAERAERERQWHVDAIERLTRASEALEATRSAGVSEIARLDRERAAAATALEEASATVDPAAVAHARAAVVQATTAAAEAGQSLAGRQAMWEAARSDARSTATRLELEEARERALLEERAALEAELETLERTVAEASRESAVADEAVAAAERSAREAERAASESTAGDQAASRHLAVLESRLTEARVAEARAEDRLARLAEQLRSDADVLLPDGPSDEASTGEVTAPSGPAEPAGDTIVADTLLEPVDELSEDVEGRIAELRRELRAIGAIDLEALATFRETRERHEHLLAEGEDLESAERDILTALERLEAEMGARFDETFGAVAEAFASFFPQLFGGGEAELVLQREDASIGIDILARPPGKRRQPLGLLSGGERSLTAVALVFALLRVSRTPFVVLDEVDAALDEANVARFRAALETLAEHTQVVIVTHNRGTIQAADTVYGITMSEDGASQVMSLQVPRTA